MNTYAAYHVLYGGVDPSGMNKIKAADEAIKLLQRYLVDLGQDGITQLHHIVTRSTYKAHKRELKEIGFQFYRKDTNCIDLPTPETLTKIRREHKQFRTGTHEDWTKLHREYNENVEEAVVKILGDYETASRAARSASDTAALSRAKDTAAKQLKDLQDDLRHKLATGELQLAAFDESVVHAESTYSIVTVSVFSIVAAHRTEGGSECYDLPYGRLSMIYEEIDTEVFEEIVEIGIELTFIGDIKTIGQGVPQIIDDLGGIRDSLIEVGQESLENRRSRARQGNDSLEPSDADLDRRGGRR